MYFSTEFQIESWILYSIGILLILFRLFLRIWNLGFRRLQTDDYFVIAVMAFYTLLIFAQNYIVRHEVDNDDLALLDPAAVDQTETNTKHAIIFEQAMLNLVYSVKACILIMISRLIMALREKRKILLLAASVYCFLGYAGTQIAFWSTCTPITAQWLYPPTTEECATFTHYYIIQLTFNISSDIVILATSIPYIMRAEIPKKQKVQLMLLYSMGIFIISAAIITKVYQFLHANIYGDSWSYISWYFREATIAVYLCNLPIIVPNLRRIYTKRHSKYKDQDSMLPEVFNREMVLR